MKNLFITCVAALFLATETAHADCCEPVVPAGHAFEVAAKRHFGRGFSSVSFWENEPKPKKIVIVDVKDTRHLGLDKNKSYLLCRYRTKPVIKFFNCFAWEGE